MKTSPAPAPLVALFFVLLSSFALIQTPAASCVNPPAGLMGWWRGEGNFVDSAQSNQGSAVGGVTVVPGKVGTGFGFDGTGYVTIPHHPSLNNSNALTIELWYKSMQNNDVYYGILDKRIGAAGANYGINVAAGVGLGVYYDDLAVQDGDDAPYGSSFEASRYAPAPEPGVFHHLAATYFQTSNNLVRLETYVDGQLVRTKFISGNLGNTLNTAPVTIGATANGAGEFFKGVIDEVSIYNRVLSGSEIQSIYFADSAGKCDPTNPPPISCITSPSGLVGWWPAEGSAVDVMGADNGTVAGQVSFAAGRVGQAFRFSGGSEKIELGDPANLRFTEAFTIEGWILASNAPAGGHAQIFFRGDMRGCLDPYYLSLQPNRAIRLHISAEDISNPCGVDLESAAVPLNQWTHVAGVFDASAGSMKIFIDGALAAQTNTTVKPFGTLDSAYSPGVAIGNHSQGFSDQGFNGLIDELAAYGRALDSNEIAGIFLAGSAGKCVAGITNPPPLAGVPAIFNFNPAVAPTGSQVSISGINFSPVVSNNIVYFGAARAPVIATSPTNLVVIVPPGATYAPISVTVAGRTALAPAGFLPSFVGNGSNLSPGSFAPGQNLMGADGPFKTIIADIDGDGKPDLVEDNAYAHNISLFRNISVTGTLDGSSFASRVDFPALGGTDSPRCMAVADVDGDGKLDIMVGDQATSSVIVYRNIATPGTLTTGSLAAPVSFAAGSYPHGLRVADLNGDGLPEILVANQSGNSISILQNTGTVGSLTTNSFAPQFVLATGPNPTDVAIADFNGDGRPDLITTAFGGTELSIFRNVATPGSAVSNWFTLDATLPALAGSLEFAVADLDGDTKSDLIVASVHGYAVSVYRNQAGTGAFSSNSFAARVDFPAPGWVHNVAVADLNGDSKPDLALTGELNSYMAVFQNQSTPGNFTTGSLAARVDYATGWNAWGIAVGDLDGDNRPDIVFANSYDDTLTLYRNIVPFGTSTNQPPDTNQPPVAAGVPIITSFNLPIATSGVAVFLTGTNFSPLAASNIVYFGAVRANVTAATPTNLVVTVPVGATYAPITVTVNGLMGIARSSFLPTFNGAGQAVTANTFAPRQDLTADYGNYQSVIADFDGDGKADLGVGNGYSHIISLFRNISTPGSNVFEPRIVFPIADANDGPAGFISADIDCDGKMDLLFTDTQNQRVGIMRNVSVPGTLTTNSFAPPVYFATGSVCFRVRVHDLDGDGRPDVVTCNQGSGTLSVLRNLGGSDLTTTSFAPAFSLATGANPHDFCIQDLDGDGKPDLAVANDQSSFVSLFKNLSVPGQLTPGSFAPAINLPTDSGQLIVNAGDVDGDGRPELLVGGRANKLSVFRNLGLGSLSSNSFAGPVDFNLPGWVHNVVLGDINGDGKPDPVVVGELDSYLAVFQNQSIPGTFDTTSLAARVDYATGWNAWSVSVGDLDGDSRPDVAFCNNYETFASIYRNALNDPLPGSCVPAPAGLVASWRAEGNALDSVSGSSGALENVSFTAGEVGQTFVFNPASGTTRIAIPDRPEFVLTNSLSIEGWIYPTGPGWTIFWRGDNRGGLDPYFLQMNPDEGNILQFIIEQESPNTAVVLGTTPLAFNQWYHIAATLDDATGVMRIYTNGVLAAETTTTIRPFANLSVGADASIGIGNLGEHWFDHPFVGNIDEISLYSRALAQSEVQAIYSAGSAGKCPLPAAPPIITQQPQSITNNVNDTVNFAVFAIGNPAPDYQWFFAGNPLVGQTSASLQLDNIQPGQAGPYFVTVSNSFGAVTSSIATLTVLTFPPAITKQPTNTTAIETTPASLSVQVTGSTPLTYQWLFNEQPLAGKTSPTLAFPSVQFSNAGNYSVLITNPYGAVTSSVAVLTVNPRPPCAPVHDGLVSWWRGENDLTDAWDSNNGSPGSVQYFTGKVGRAMVSPRIQVNDAPSLRVTNALTLEAWVNPSTVSGSTPYTIVSKFDYPFTGPGRQSSYYLALTNGRVMFMLSGTGYSMTNTTLFSAQTIPINQWSHLAATYDGTTMRIYINGVVVTNRTHSGGIFAGNLNLGLGSIPPSPTFSGTANPFSGLLDEVSLYQRALSDVEVQAIYNADLTGKCFAPPVLTQHPQNQTIPLGEDVRFTVTVTGSRPLRYQWLFNGTNLPAATNATLVLEKVKSSQAGLYSVRVSNILDTVSSSNATLALLPAPGCTETPAGLISWWPGDGNALDVMGTNSILNYSPPIYSTGKVGQTFTFNGASSRIQINNSASLNFNSNANFSIEMWIKATPTNTLYPNVPLFEKRTSVTTGWVGYSLSLNQGQLAFAMGTPGTTAPGALSNYISSGPDLRDALFHHVAVTVNRSTTNGGVLYVDGVPVLTFNPKPLNVSLVNTSPLYLGAPTATLSNSYFAGLIDEPAIYSRDLTAAEILSIRTAGAAGRCKAAPIILTQPLGQSVTNGASITLSVVATGTPTLRYQWRRNVVPLAGATNSTLLLANISSATIGTYSVSVSNLFGTVLSSNAVVALNRLPVANPDAFTTPSNTPAVFPVAKLLLNDSDPDGDPLTVTAVSPNSARNGTVSLVSGLVTYTPPSGFVGNDTFGYTLADARGGTTNGTVMATVGLGGAAPLNIVFGPVVADGQFIVRFAGIPSLTYTIEASASLAGGWTKVANLTAPATDTGLGIGVFEFREPMLGEGARYYRTVYPSY